MMIMVVVAIVGDFFKKMENLRNSCVLRQSYVAFKIVFMVEVS